MGIWKSDPPSITEGRTLYMILRDSNKKSEFQGLLPPSSQAVADNERSELQGLFPPSSQAVADNERSELQGLFPPSSQAVADNERSELQGLFPPSSQAVADNERSELQGLFPPSSQALLKEAIRTSYQPGEGEGKPSEDDINAAYETVAIRTAAYLTLKPMKGDKNQEAFLEANLSPAELEHLRKVAGDSSLPDPVPFIVQSLLVFLEEQRLGKGKQAAYQIYADLLNAVSEDKIKAFGNQMLDGSGSTDSHARQTLLNLEKTGIFDKDTYEAFRQALGNKGAEFMAYFKEADDDIPAFASKARNWDSTNSILEALAQEQNVASALSYALGG
ncbi:hypothetical protein PENCOP_c010G01077 [Penicillium coprophilum]|uniref:Uncharacterized protein n=1 Tax=Penicillium coprophilum TaxID=36646 RepID=A0A1V6UFI5_9EURO|nr:hypothetical protein PENCOP_c010G01077 [Penicillium coprophilum]